ncbi:MAG: hypothetical protein KAJ19_03955 [Gammaproteobacteria bacterium]|nr:hypothetical protein [Gammaproteobacteria bacterium]
MSRWICTTACRALGQNYKVGAIEEYPANPLSGHFEAYSGDKILPVNSLAKTDLDNTYYFPKPGWDDLRFPATLIRQGATTKPDFDTTNLGLLFPQDDPTEIAYIIAQMPHAMKQGTALHPHVHYVQDEVEEPVFKMDYRIYDIGADPTVGFITIEAVYFTETYVNGSIHQLLEFPEISTSAIIGVSAIMDIKLYRDDNVVAGDVLVKEFDFHYQLDSPGSGREDQK